MTRGDQRDRDRAKNQAKQAAKIKSQGRSGDPLSRNLNDATALQAKVAAKQAKIASEGESCGSTTTTSAVKAPTKAVTTNKKGDSVDDLLMAGLQGTQKTKKLAT